MGSNAARVSCVDIIYRKQQGAKRVGKSKRKNKQKSRWDGTGLAFFLIGLGVLFLLDDHGVVNFWPWILVVLALSGVPSSIAHEGLWAGLQGLVWAGGIAILFETDLWWPGILIVIGAGMLVGALVRPPVFKKTKRKRDALPQQGYHD